MRVLFVSNFYPPHHIGGYELHCAEVADRLEKREHEVHVLTSRHGVSGPTRENGVHRLLFLECGFEHYAPWHFFARHWREEHANARFLQELLTGIAPDVVLFWGMWHLSWTLPALAEASSIPVAYYLEDLWPTSTDPHTEYWTSRYANPFKQTIKGAAAHLAFATMRLHGFPPHLRFRHAACGSRFLQRKLAETIPAFQEASIAMCGIDLKPFQQAAVARSRLALNAKTLRLIYVGRLDPLKGVHNAIEALAYLRDLPDAPQATLTVVGSGHPDYEARLRDLVTSHSLCDKISMIGSVSLEQIPRLLSKHDCQIVPSIVEEGFGRVLLEGMAAGLAVVATGTGGSGEILEDGVNGLRFPPGDAVALADCLLRLAQDPDLYGQLVTGGQITAARFDLEAMTDGIEKFLWDVIAEHSLRKRGASQ